LRNRNLRFSDTKSFFFSIFANFARIPQTQKHKNTKTQKHQKVFEGLRAAAGDGTSAQRHEPVPVGHWCQRQENNFQNISLSRPPSLYG